MFLELRKILMLVGVLLLAGTAAFVYYGMTYRYAHVPLRTALIPQPNARVGQAADGLVFSSDGKTLIVADTQSGLSQWSVPNLRCENRTLVQMTDGISTTNFSPSGNILTVADSSEVHRWTVDRIGFTELPTKQYQLRHATFFIKGYRSDYRDSFPLHLVSPSGKLAAGVNMDGDIIVTETKTGRQLFAKHTLLSDGKDHLTNVCDIAFSPDDRLIAVSWFTGGISVASAPLNITLYNVQTEKLQRHWQWKDAETVNVLDGSNDNIGNLGTTGLVFSSDGLYLAAADSDHAAIWETRTGKLLHILTHIGNPWVSRKRLLFLQENGLLTGCGWGNHVPIWNVHSGKLLQTFYASSFTEAIAVSPNDKLLATGGQDASFSISTARGKQVVLDSTQLLAGQQSETINGSIALWDISRLDNK